ncbi:hypothetical protein AXF35_12550 [Legionella pneumophila subsp. pascullei]|nr:hypothetical protein AXF35_12550 [Legionella pneumophila subsp. pascullei]AMP91855.1 hypothetical protein AXF36_04250 [Legionella pneumophila subsp. pascullei]AMP94821.1 hypothetical protein AXF37_04140 [Legionella pneumophila subsp. pascullei]
MALYQFKINIISIIKRDCNKAKRNNIRLVVQKVILMMIACYAHKHVRQLLSLDDYDFCLYITKNLSCTELKMVPV